MFMPADKAKILSAEFKDVSGQFRKSYERILIDK